MFSDEDNELNDKMIKKRQTEDAKRKCPNENQKGNLELR
jgi:hypothetical protein